MSANPNYQIFKIDLTTAGQMDIPAIYTYLRVVDAYATATGVVSLDAKINVQPRRTGGDHIPMRLNGLVQLPRGSDFARITWAAQPGTTVELFMSDQDRGAGIDVEAPPTKQIVTSSIGTTLTCSAATVGVAAAQLVAANAARQSVTIVNNSVGTVFIGQDATVTTANGLPVTAGQSLVIDKTTAAIWAIGSGAGLNVRLMVEA